MSTVKFYHNFQDFIPLDKPVITAYIKAISNEVAEHITNTANGKDSSFNERFSDSLQRFLYFVLSHTNPVIRSEDHVKSILTDDVSKFLAKFIPLYVEDGLSWRDAIHELLWIDLFCNEKGCHLNLDDSFSDTLKVKKHYHIIEKYVDKCLSEARSAERRK